MLNVIRNRPLSGFMFGHLSNDMFMGVLTALLPILKSEYHLSNAQIGVIALVQSGSGSLFQPLFGLVADRIRLRLFVPIIVLWDSACVAGFGFAGSERHLLVFAVLLGVGSAAFHPYGASGAAHASEPETLNAALSAYTVAGTAGYAIGPVIATLFIAIFGKHGTLGFLPIGLTAAVLIASRSSGRESPSHGHAHRAANTDSPTEWGKLARIIGIVMVRSWVYLALLNLLPIHYKELGFRLGFYNSLPTIMILAGGFGTLIGGRLADSVSGKRIIIGSQLLTVIPVIICARIDASPVVVFLVLFGLLSDSSLSLTLIAAQRLLPGRTGLASGVILGLGFVSGSLGVPLTGALADRTSIGFALTCAAMLAFVAVALTATIPSAIFQFSRRSAPRDRVMIKPTEGTA